MEIQNKIGEQVFDKLRSKFKQITLGDAEGNATQNPTDAVFFNFNYIDEEGTDHGNITVSLIDRTMKIYYSKNISKDLEGSELSQWYEFLQDMRKTAKSQLYGFDTHDISKSALDIQDINATVTRNDVAEGKMYGSKKRSYQDHGPAKIIVRHTENIDADVRGSRSRKVESVFVETIEGERFKMPFKNLPGTRAMAQHIGQGGRPYDEIGESISLMVSEIADLKPFVSRNRNAIYEDETTMQMVEAAREYYKEARSTLSKMKGKRGYKTYAESFQVTEQELFGDDDADSMKERFTKKRFSDKMEAAMPVVKKAYSLKNMKPKTPGMKPVKPITEFEEWTEEVTEMPEQSIIHESCAEILTPDEKQEVLQWLSGYADDISNELFQKLFDYYTNNGEMPYGTAKARTGDPFEWLFNHLADEYRSEIPESSGEEMCSTECCGKPVSQCHCGPECPHCDCHAKNKLDEDSDGKVYGMFAKGGPIGGSDNKKPWKTGSREDMMAYAKRMRKQLSPGERKYYGMGYTVRPMKAGEDLNEEQLDEGILQGLYNFMWNMTGKIPRVAKARKSDQLKQEYNRFVEKMDDATVDAWIDELAAKVKGTATNTTKAKMGRLETLRKVIKKVKAADSEKRFVGIMQKLNSELRQYEKFVKSSNAGGVQRKRTAKNKATQARKAAGGVGTPSDNELAAWVKKGGKGLVKPNRRGHGSKTESVMEGTWAIPDTPEKQEELQQLLQSPLAYGVNGDNASNAIYHLLGDDELFDNLYQSSEEFGPEADARREIIHHLKRLQKLIDQERRGAHNEVDWGVMGESITEDSQLTDNITSNLINRLEDQHPEVFQRHGSEYIYSMVRDEVSFYTDDVQSDEEFGSSDSYGAWKNVLRNLDIGNGEFDDRELSEDEFDEARGRIKQDRKVGGDVIKPKATYSDYLEVYKSSKIGGTNEEDDANRMVKALNKDGKDADHKAAKGALKRMAEQEAKSGLHMNEGLKELAQLRRDAGIIK